MSDAEFWIDMNLPPSMASWLSKATGSSCTHFSQLGLETATDSNAFRAEKEAGVVVLTKDRDLADLVRIYGPPPQVVWIRLGNTTNHCLRKLLEPLLDDALAALTRGEQLIEITAPN